MHVVIGGYGRVGRYLAHMLEGAGHTIAVVDHNPSAFDEFGDDIRGRKLAGPVFDRGTLLKAGIEKADAFAAVTSGDNSNIVAARVARERFGVKNVVARIFDPRRAVIYERFGIPTISSVQWASSRLLAMVLEPNLRVDQAYGGGEVVTAEIDVRSKLAGRRIGDVDHPGTYSVTAVVRSGIAMLATPDFELAPGDKLHVTVVRDSLDELIRLCDPEEG